MLISAKQFAGNAGVSDGPLAQALREVAQTLAIRSASTISDLIDSSGGTGNATIADIPGFTLSAVGSNNAVAKAEAETALIGIGAGLANIREQINLIRAVVPAFAALTDSMGFTPGASKTIAAIDVSATGAGTSLASAVGMNTAYRTLRSRIWQIATFVNKLCVATGTTPLVISLANFDAVHTTVLAAVSTNTGTAVTGSSAAEANACVLKTEWDARQLLMANAIADLAAKLNAITADANATKSCPLIAV